MLRARGPEQPLAGARTVEVSLSAAHASLTLVPGKQTGVHAYDGQVPGPTLELTEREHVVVHFENRLPEPTTIHWHGRHVPAANSVRTAVAQEPPMNVRMMHEATQLPAP